MLLSMGCVCRGSDVTVRFSWKCQRSAVVGASHASGDCGGGPDTGLRTTKLCQYIRGQSAMASCRLRGAQILSSRLTSPAVCNDVEGDLLPLVEGAHARAFDRADMNEDILVAALGLNEPTVF
jgi:hypothetical protein